MVGRPVPDRSGSVGPDIAGPGGVSIRRHPGPARGLGACRPAGDPRRGGRAGRMLGRGGDEQPLPPRPGVARERRRGQDQRARRRPISRSRPSPCRPAWRRLELQAWSSVGADGDLRLRASIREGRGEPVRLTALAWEPVVPPADPHVPGFRRGGLDSEGIASSFGTSALPAGGTLQSGAIRLKNVHRETGPLVVKLIGTDARGHRVSAWAEVNREALGRRARDRWPLAERIR